MELIMQLREVDRLARLSNALEAQGREIEADTIYGQMWRLATEAASTLCEVLEGQIGYHEALNMVIHQDGTIINIITMAA